jgi:hypothetical protein
MLRDNLAGLIEPRLCSAGTYPLALCTKPKQSSDDRPPCLENPRPEGAEPTLPENVPSPFHAEPRQIDLPFVPWPNAGDCSAFRERQGGTHRPIPLYSPEPEYSDKARSAKISGSVELSVAVGVDGGRA